MTQNVSGATANQVVIPTCTPKNGNGKTIADLSNFIASLIPEAKKTQFLTEYGSNMQTLPFELEGNLSVTGGWGSFVIDLMCNAQTLRATKGYTFVSKTKIAKVCAIAFLGLLDMYEENTGRSRYYNQFYKFKDGSTSLFSHERTFHICSRFGIELDEEDIECISFNKNISNGEKMTLIHASATARLFYSAYLLTKVDHSL